MYFILWNIYWNIYIYINQPLPYGNYIELT